MPTRGTGRAPVAADRLIFACHTDSRARARLQTALRGHADLRWFAFFEEMRQAMDAGERPTATVVGLIDASGASALDFARNVRDDMTGTPIVVYCDIASDERKPMAALAVAGVHDVLFTELNDEGFSARDVI